MRRKCRRNSLFSLQLFRLNTPKQQKNIVLFDAVETKEDEQKVSFFSLLRPYNYLSECWRFAV